MGRPVPRLAAVALACAGVALADARPDPAAADRATLVADLLVRADGPETRAGKRERAAALRTLDRLGAHPLDAAPVPRDAAALPFRGRLLGPAWQRGSLEAGATTTLEQAFMAGQRASIAVAGAGAPAATLMLTVAEAGEAPVCREAPRSCRWLPLYTQRYAITLRNPGAARVRYYLVVD